MQEDKSHSPLPFRVDKSERLAVNILANDGEKIISMFFFSSSLGPEKAAATAEFIVAACNEYYENKRKADLHYELLHWVKLMLDIPYLNDVGRVSLKKAIAKAEGK